jgi:radical SAM protein with 4Fe4S-binding SPASM domain
MVKHRLVKECEDKLDVLAIKDFALRCIDRYEITEFPVHFFGGESLLAVDECLSLIEELESIDGLTTRFSLYSNLAMELTKKHMALFDKVFAIGVSIDGLEDQHNLQRLPISKDMANPFEVTILNLKELVLAGFKDKIEVQACLRDEFNTEENRAEIYRLILQFGVTAERITIGTIAPTKLHPKPDEMYLTGIAQPKLSHQCCCKYRPNVLMTDYSGNVFSDYYTYTKLGTIHDDLEVIEREQEKLTKKTMPVFNDPKCQECPVVGYCWGGCSMQENMEEPLSKYCNQEGILKSVQELANANLLMPQKRDKKNESLASNT